MDIRKVLCFNLIVVLYLVEKAETKHKIHSPCKPLTYRCAKGFFSQYGTCRRIRLSNLDTATAKKFVIESHFFNATTVRKNMKITGLRRTMIKRLGVDKKDKVTILVTYFPRVFISGNQTVYFHDHGEPDIKAATKYKYNLDKVLVTTIFKGTKNLKWKKSRSFSNIFKTPKYEINSFPDLVPFARKYRLVSQTAERVAAHPEILARDEISVIGRLLAEAYFKKALCR